MGKRIAALLLLLVFLASGISVSAAEVSEEELSDGKFVPCEYIPSFATVPDFYTPIESVTCMYMFIDCDGNAHRRWYGSVDGAYGWYAVADGEQKVADYSMPINVEDDRAMLYPKVENIYSSESDLGYVGILPPEESRKEVAELFGVPIKKFIVIAGTGVAVLCMIILVAAVSVKSRKKRRFHF